VSVVGHGRAAVGIDLSAGMVAAARRAYPNTHSFVPKFPAAEAAAISPEAFRDTNMTKLAETVAGARVAGSRVLQASRKADPEGRMPVMGHLRELRNRIVKATLAIGLGTVLGIIFFGPIWAVVTHPFCSAVITGDSGCKA
jgi:hypothetical protein